MLSEALTEVFITAYETELRMPFFFRSRLAENTFYDFEMWKVGRSTSAAPTYFKPFKLDSETEKGYFSLIDGGIYANNPAMCAYAEAKALSKFTTDIMILSLGTGEFTKSIDYESIKNWGMLKWAQPAFVISMDGVNDTVEYQLNQILASNRHYRLQVSLAELGKDEMDNATNENIQKLMILGQKLIDQNLSNGTLYAICDCLL
jgi:patatin-like phospholipase/acyl hydrolase